MQMANYRNSYASDTSSRPPSIAISGSGSGFTGDNQSRQPQLYRRLSQAKVVLLGDVAAGKTSFLNALRYGKSHLTPGGPAGRTVGIEVHSVELTRDARLWFYDFGGHETYHFSQGLFLTQKAIYMLLVDIASYNSKKFRRCVEYWYTVLTSQLVSPVICVVATHIDLCPPQHVTWNCQNIVEMLYKLELRHLARIRKQLQKIDADIEASVQGQADPVYDFQASSLKQPREKLEDLLKNRPRVYPTVCKVSSKTLEGIQTASRIMLDIIRNNSDSFPQCVVSDAWLKLGDALAAKREELPFLRWTHFQAMAAELGIGKFETRQALKYLQTTGIVVHYEDYKKQSELRDLVFNNTNLLLSIFGLIFNHNYFNDEMRYVWHNRAMNELPREDMESLQRNLRREGIIGEKLLRCFWSSLGLTDDVIHAVMSLLEKFDLCYEVSTIESKHLPTGRHFRFPYLLKSMVPTEAESIWTRAIPDNFIEYQLRLSLETDELPVGFLEKVSVRINPYLDLRVDWKSGIVAFCNDGQDIVKVEVMVDSGATTSVMLHARVRHDRRDMARHILLLLVAVINKVLLRQYPGIVGYWYVGCAHCVALTQDSPATVVDVFPADNLVFTTIKDLTVVCRNCTQGQVLKASEVFPTLADTTQKTEKMGPSEMKAVRSVFSRLSAEVDARQLLTVLLKQGVIDLRQAEDVTNQQPNDRRMQKLLKLLSCRGHRGFVALCQAVRTDGESPSLAQQLEAVAETSTGVPEEKSVDWDNKEATSAGTSDSPSSGQKKLSYPQSVPRGFSAGPSTPSTENTQSVSPRDAQRRAFFEHPPTALKLDDASVSLGLSGDATHGDAPLFHTMDASTLREDLEELDPVFSSLAWRIFCLVGAKKEAAMSMGLDVKG